MTAKPAESIERTGHAAAASALVQLKPAVGAATFVAKVEHHRRLVAARAEAWSDQS